jgi:hypothetical protein
VRADALSSHAKLTGHAQRAREAAEDARGAMIAAVDAIAVALSPNLAQMQIPRRSAEHLTQVKIRTLDNPQ